MNATQLLRHFDRLAEAPDAVPRLRRFILDLAVRGKLVEQDAGDEPAAQLLERARLDSADSQATGKVSKVKPLSPIAIQGQPYVAPKGWIWVRMGRIGETNIGLTYSPANLSQNGTPVLRSSNIQNGKIDLSDLVRVSSAVKHSALVRDGDLLICARNGSKALVGKTAQISGLTEQMAFGAFMAIFRSPYNPYLLRFINSSLFRQMISDVNTTTINQITQENLKSALLPLPPLAEQHRIVAKVDELMALCDQLEAAQQERERRRDRLASASLQRLNQPAEANPATDQAEAAEAHQQAQREQQKDHARFHLQNLDLLIARPEHLAAIRATILQLAVTGYLVACDPRDEPASSLLGQVAAGRTVRRKIAQLNVEELETALLAIPRNWTWTVIDQIAADDDNAITDGPFGANLKTEHYIAQSGYRVIRLQNIGHGIFRDEHYAFVDAERFHRLSKHHVRAGDLVVAGLVDPAVRCAELPPNIGPALVKADCYRFAVAPSFSSRFALHYLNSPACQEFALVHHHGMTLTRIGLGNFRRIPFPVPPLAEQHRIVAKVDELMALCDQLEAQLTRSQTDSRRLLEAVLDAALAPA